MKQSIHVWIGEISKKFNRLLRVGVDFERLRCGPRRLRARLVGRELVASRGGPVLLLLLLLLLLVFRRHDDDDVCDDESRCF